MKRSVLAVGIFLAFIITIQLSNAMGMSVLPAFIKMNVIRGQQFEIPISVSNPGDEVNVYSINAAEDITGWVNFYDGNKTEQIDSITVSPISSSSFVAKFSIPRDINNGKYMSYIYIETAPGDNVTGNSSSLSIKIPVAVSLEVTGSQFLTGQVNNITVSDIEINKLLRVKTEFENTGDVVATPVIESTVSKNGVEVGSFIHNTTSVGVNKSDVIFSEWDATGLTVGIYELEVKVYLAGSVIKDVNLGFEIMERGTFTAGGKVEEIKASSQVETGKTERIEVTFQNIGQIDVTAKISGEVYQGQSLIDTIEGDETLVRAGESEILTAYFKPTAEGTYTIRSNVIYEGKKEPISEIVIDSRGVAAVSANGSYDNIIIFVIIAVVLIVTFIIYRYRQESF
jgi:hypothetical protein